MTPRDLSVLDWTEKLVEFEALAPVTQDMLIAYAAASGDSNTIHLDEAIARKMGLPGVIAHGMLVAAWVADRGLLWVHQQGLQCPLVSSQYRFRGMTVLGEVLSVGGKATLSTPKLAATSLGKLLTLDLEAKGTGGAVKVTGRLVFRLH